MPALRFSGRKWLAASDDLVFPGLFEIAFRILWLVLVVLIYTKYYEYTWECSSGGLYVRLYIIGMMSLLIAVILVLVALVNRSAQGSIMDAEARKFVPAILGLKLFLILPEIVLNVFGTLWAFCPDVVNCPEEHFSKTVIEGLVIFNWVLFGLAIFGLALIFDPVGSQKYTSILDTPNEGETLRHRKLSSIWQRRFKWLFCCVQSDEQSHEAIHQIASFLTTLFRSTDLVPSDIIAGCILLRVKQKRETRELRRMQMLSNDEPKYTTDLNRITAVAPKWMNLEQAQHFLRLSMGIYGWPYVMYRHCFTGIFKLMKNMTCCACFRNKRSIVTDDNCCMCHLAGVRYYARVDKEDIIFASFRNNIFELPFCVVADHKTSSIVIALRGSISLTDLFTDLVANTETFEAEGLPPDTKTHKGMALGAENVLKRLKETGILETAFATYPSYGLVLTGHSLGAAVATLLALKIRPQYPDLKVYAFGTPAGLITREAARYTESFVFTVGLGHDFIMRTGVDSIENIRTSIIQTLHACKLPKYRIMLNGFGYALFGVPVSDLESVWKNDMIGKSPLLSRNIPTVAATTEAAMLSRDLHLRRFSNTRLFTPGRILHIAVRKKTKSERKTRTGGPTYELKWAASEDFSKFRIMPNMIHDHLPESVYESISIILEESKSSTATTNGTNGNAIQNI